jgi:outer membrane protein
MNWQIRYAVIAGYLLIITTRASAELDPFSVEKNISVSPAKNMMANNTVNNSCHWEGVTSSVDLLEAVERALCYNPQTRQAWANVKIQAAQVGVAESAYLPTVNMSASYSYGPNSYQVQDTPELSYNSKTTARNMGLNTNWVLFDFGLRRANLEKSRQLLIAANATQDATLQTVFILAAQSYYDLLSAQSALDAYLESEKFSEESFKAAEAKYIAGVGTLADKLQAQTDFAQAKLDRVKAVGDLKIAQGTLALAMGLDANALVMAKVDTRDIPDTAFVTSVDQLIADAKRTHPTLLAAQADLAAAKANISAIQDEGLPSVSLIGGMNRNHQAGQPPSAIDNNNSSIGIQVTIPLFEGFGRNYQVRVAQAQAESKAADLADTEQKVSLDVWKNYQILVMETENLNMTQELLSSARQSFDVARGRYKAGVGNLIELLNAQNALAKAEQQRVQALSNWHVARLKLANSLGRLGFWALHA